jgi:hypothetical protein
VHHLSRLMPMNQLNSLANVKPEKWVQPTSTGSGVLRLVASFDRQLRRPPVALQASHSRHTAPRRRRFTLRGSFTACHASPAMSIGAAVSSGRESTSRVSLRPPTHQASPSAIKNPALITCTGGVSCRM